MKLIKLRITNQISIPTGSIKIADIEYQRNLDQISIPTGSIKINMALTAAAASVIFQFQLVRLKSKKTERVIIFYK